MKTFPIFFALFLGIVLVAVPSCKKDVEGCTDPDAENYNAEANIDNGGCTYARDKFLGAYNVNENCTSGTFSYAISVIASTTETNGIVISNFGDYGVNIRATVTGANLAINDTQAGITFSGSGSIAGNTLTIIYTASAGGLTDNCTKTCIKL
jgi:hypothetical protein